MSTGFKTATVASADVPATQTNFPVYIDLSRLGITTQADADSVRVYADSGKTTEWAREIVSATEMHVKVPSLTSTTSIYVYWDGTSADYAVTDTYGRNAVWSGYAAVWHLGETSGSALDSSGNGNNLTDNNSVTSATGKLGGARDFERATAEYFSISDASQTGLDMTGDFTLQTWYQLETSGITQVLASKSNFPTIGLQWYFDTTNKIFLFASSDNTTTNRSAWSTTAGVTTSGLNMHHLTFDVNGTANPTVAFYINGASVAGGVAWASGMDGGMSDNANNFSIGSEPYSTTSSFDGLMDEVRFRNSLLSANWITTEYNNQSDEAGFWGTWSDVGGATNTTNFFLMM